MIRVREATKRYGETLAVDRVSFEIAAGEIVGFLGPNGSGKSTLLRMLSTYLAPTSGELSVANHDVVRDALRARAAVGYLTEHNALYEDMRVERWLEFLGRARGLSRTAIDERIGWVVERCELATVLGRRISQCSKGFRQRLGVAGALLHDPPVLLLDEPTHGLDPLQGAAFRDFVRELRAGRAILFSSHVLAEVAEISDRVLLLGRGRLRLDAPLRELRERAEREDTTLEGLILGISAQAERAPEETAA